MSDHRPLIGEPDDGFESEVAAWLELRGRPERAELAAVRASIPSLPARSVSRRRLAWLGSGAVAATIAVVVGALLLGPRFLSQASSSPAFGGPGAYASDPRVVLCGSPEGAGAIFELAHLRDYRTAFPAMRELTILTEADLAQPALVYVTATPASNTRMGASAESPVASTPVGYGVCFVVGPGPETWYPISVGGVDLTGFVAPAVSTDPADWAGDPRFASCIQGHVAEPAIVFEMTHAQWFPLHFPGWSQGAPELEVDDPALVVVGREQHWPRMGGPPRSGQSIDPDADLAYQMCIAVGPTSGFITHDYGVTHFDRIVPTLSPDDVARAAGLDPEVLADPAVWPSPERLAVCGGTFADIQYVFDVRPLRDAIRMLPGVPPAAFDREDSGTIVIFRSPSPLAIRRLVGAPHGPTIHDVCVIDNDLDGPPAILPDVDIAGFHIRLNRQAPPAPVPTPIPLVAPSGPSTTPQPAPAWAGDAQVALQCDGPPSNFGRDGPVGVDRADTGPSPETTLRQYIAAVTAFALPFPTAGFGEALAADGARLYAYRVDGRVKAAVAAVGVGGRENGRWFVGSVASCDPSEFDPTVRLGGGLTIWTDAAWERVSTAVLSETADCYQGTQLRFEGRLFVRVPFGGVDEATLEVPYRAATTLPADASRQPYTDGSRRLYLAASGKAAFVVDGATVERWPHVIGDEVSRTDCN